MFEKEVKEYADGFWAEIDLPVAWCEIPKYEV